MRAGGDEKLVIAQDLAAIQDDLLFLQFETDGLAAAQPVHMVERLEIRLGEVQALQGPLAAQVLVQDAAGIDIFILGYEDDLALLVKFAQLAHGVDAGGGGAEDHVSHLSTSTSVMACMGHFSTHMGFGVLPSVLRCTHILHFMISLCPMESYFRMPKGQDMMHI